MVVVYKDWKRVRILVYGHQSTTITGCRGERGELDFQTKGIDNMIKGLPGDQVTVAYLVTFSVISGSRHLDLLVGTLQQINKPLCKMTVG